MRVFPGLESGALAAWVDQLTHDSVASRPLERARRQSFIIARLAVAACVLLSAPVWLLFNGLPDAGQLALFLIAQAPLIAVTILARTGDLRLAQSVSALGWISLAVAFDLFTQSNGIVSLMLLTIALVEAALAMQATTLAVVICVAIVAVAGSAFSHAGGLQGAIQASALIAPLLLYAALLASGSIRAEHARSEADERNARDMRLLTGAIGDIIIHLDRTGAVFSLVGDVHKTYGMEARDLLGRGFFQRVHVADRPAFLKLVSDTVGASGPINAVLRLQVGSVWNPATQIVEPIFNYFDARTCSISADGQAGALDASSPIICILRDITTKRRAEEEIADARRQSELAVAAKTRFLANISHELRTPLSAIIGFSEMLGAEKLEPTDPQKRREYAHIIRDSGYHLLEVVNTILDMSKIESGSMQLIPEPFSLSDLADQCCSMMQLKADQGGVTLERQYSDIHEIVADKRACKQILINLLSNAVKFTPTPGHIGISIRPEGNTLAISVLDTGIGIAAGDLDRLGDPFFQASASNNRAYEGTGLGLSVVRGLVGLHGGSMTVESAPNAGTRVTVNLPLDCRNRIDHAATPVRIETIARRGAVALHTERTRSQDTVKKIA